MNFIHQEPRMYAQKLIEYLGPPTDVLMPNEDILGWRDIDSYREIWLRDEAISHDFPKPHKDFIYATVCFPEITADIACKLIKVSGSINVDLLKKEVTARCGAMIKNDITLSFVMDVIDGEAPATKKEYSNRILNNIVTHPDIFFISTQMGETQM